MICHDTPHLSLHQPHALSWPPLPTIAFQRRSVSAWSSVATWNENASLCLNAGPPFRPTQGMPSDGEVDREHVALLAGGIVAGRAITVPTELSGKVSA